MSWQRANLEEIPAELQAWVGLDLGHTNDNTRLIPSTESKLEPATASSTN
jgi:hypothetical protein